MLKCKIQKTNNMEMPQVVILAGGLGTRLREKTKFIPKSLVEVNGTPILTYILDWAYKQGCKDGLILTGYLGEMFQNFKHEMNIQFIQETEPLGTGGALWNAREYLEKEFILLWGDDYHPIDYSSLYSTHKNEKSPLTITVTKSHDTMNLKHSNGRVIAYNKSHPRDDFNGYEAGTSIVTKEVIENLGKDGKWSWEETVYPTLSGQIVAHMDNTKFWDMGTPERLKKLEDFFQNGSLG